MQDSSKLRFRDLVGSRGAAEAALAAGAYAVWELISAQAPM